TLDSQGRATKIATPDGAVITLTLDGHGQVTVLTDPIARVATFTYAYGASAGDMTQITYPDGSHTDFTYDGTYHNVTKITDTMGNSTTVSYSGSHPSKIENAKNEVTTLVWSSSLLQS